MQKKTVAKVEKVSKGVIKITFPEGSKAQLLKEVSVRELLTVLEGKSGLNKQSVFPLDAPDPM